MSVVMLLRGILEFLQNFQVTIGRPVKYSDSYFTIIVVHTSISNNSHLQATSSLGEALLHPLVAISTPPPKRPPCCLCFSPFFSENLICPVLTRQCCCCCRDTAGRERFKEITTEYYRGAMVSGIIYFVRYSVSFAPRNTLPYRIIQNSEVRIKRTAVSP